MILSMLEPPGRKFNQTDAISATLNYGYVYQQHFTNMNNKRHMLSYIHFNT